jgi:hypothetical protein
MPALTNPFSPVTEADLARARVDPAFRHKLLQQSLDILLNKLQKHRQSSRSSTATPVQMREGVTLAVRLAELIQSGPVAPSRKL